MLRALLMLNAAMPVVVAAGIHARMDSLSGMSAWGGEPVGTRAAAAAAAAGVLALSARLLQANLLARTTICRTVPVTRPAAT